MFIYIFVNGVHLVYYFLYNRVLLFPKYIVWCHQFEIKILLIILIAFKCSYFSDCLI